MTPSSSSSVIAGKSDSVIKHLYIVECPIGAGALENETKQAELKQRITRIVDGILGANGNIRQFYFVLYLNAERRMFDPARTSKFAKEVSEEQVERLFKNPAFAGLEISSGRWDPASLGDGVVLNADNGHLRVNYSQIRNQLWELRSSQIAASRRPSGSIENVRILAVDPDTQVTDAWLTAAETHPAAMVAGHYDYQITNPAPLANATGSLQWGDQLAIIANTVDMAGKRDLARHSFAFSLKSMKDTNVTKESLANLEKGVALTRDQISGLKDLLAWNIELLEWNGAQVKEPTLLNHYEGLFALLKRTPTTNDALLVCLKSVVEQEQARNAVFQRPIGSVSGEHVLYPNEACVTFACDQSMLRTRDFWGRSRIGEGQNAKLSCANALRDLRPDQIIQFVNNIQYVSEMPHRIRLLKDTTLPNTQDALVQRINQTSMRRFLNRLVGEIRGKNQHFLLQINRDEAENIYLQQRVQHVQSLTYLPPLLGRELVRCVETEIPRLQERQVTSARLLLSHLVLGATTGVSRGLSASAPSRSSSNPSSTNRGGGSQRGGRGRGGAQSVPLHINVENAPPPPRRWETASSSSLNRGVSLSSSSMAPPLAEEENESGNRERSYSSSYSRRGSFSSRGGSSRSAFSSNGEADRSLNWRDSMDSPLYRTSSTPTNTTRPISLSVGLQYQSSAAAHSKSGSYRSASVLVPAHLAQSSAANGPHHRNGSTSVSLSLNADALEEEEDLTIITTSSSLEVESWEQLADDETDEKSISSVGSSGSGTPPSTNGTGNVMPKTWLGNLD